MKSILAALQLINLVDDRPHFLYQSMNAGSNA